MKQIFEAPSHGARRLGFLDACRGLLCMTMALDHGTYLLWSGAREASFLFWHGPFTSDESVPEALIRLGSNLCAPGFFLLMGCGISLSLRGREASNRPGISMFRHLVLRGLLLIVLQFVLENVLWSLKPNESWFNYVGVMYALGFSLIASSFLSRLPAWILGTLAGVLLILPEVMAHFFRGAEDHLPLAVALTVLAGKSHGLIVYFSALPWTGFCLLGIIFGRLLATDVSRGLWWAGVLGPACILGALLIRALGGSGNLGIVEGHGWAGFLTFVKYSPSLAYAFWNLGWILLSWPLFARLWTFSPRALGPMLAFGKSSLFFYFGHLGLFAVLSRLMGAPGVNLQLATGICLVGLLLLWPLCSRYSRFKSSTAPDSWWRNF